MPIFGARDQFGRSRFGQANYGELSLYELLPRIHRTLDEERGEPLKKLLSAFQEEIEDLRREIDLLPFQRDPYLATGLDYPTEMLVTAGANVASGVQITFDVDHDLSGTDQVDIIGGTGFELNGRYQVRSVIDDRNVIIDAPALNDINSVNLAHASRVHPSACLVEVKAITVYEETWGDQKKPMTRLTLTNESLVDDIGVGYFGVLKAYQPVPPPENAFIDPDQALYRVLYVRRRDRAVGADTELICEGGLRLEDLTGEIPDRIVFRFVRPSSLSLLANDYGLVTDENLPDVFQRTEIANVYQFLRLKSSRPAYEARSRGGGFRVSVTHLYKICDTALRLVPEHNVYVGETGGGNTAYYSNISVIRPRYDELSADLVLPGDIPITDVTFFAAPAISTLNREIDAYFQCMFKGIVKKIYRFTPNGGTREVYGVDIEIPTYPNDGWQITSVDGGSVSIVDESGNEYSIEGSLDGPPGAVVAYNRFIIDAENLFFEVEDEVCFAYLPTEQDIDCCFCPSAEIMIEIEALPAFINQSGYSGSALADAYSRILSRLKREQVPIHVHVAIETLVVNIEVEAPVFEVEPAVTIEVEDILVDFLEGQNFDTRFDDTPADDEPLDLGAETLTYPGVALFVEDPVVEPPDDLTINITVDPLPEPEFGIIIDAGVVREIFIEGGAHFDDVPADEMETDNDLVSLEPKVTVEVT